MGALNHSQYLFKSRPWEQKCVLYFDIFNIEMSRLKVDLRNIEILRISPLMIEGYRYWLNNISRYSYNFLNIKSTNHIYLKINNLNFIKLSWMKLISFLEFSFFISILNSYEILLKTLNIKNNLVYSNKNKFSHFFYLFFVDNADMLAIKILGIFSKKLFGYTAYINYKTNIFNKIQNELNLCFFDKNSHLNYVNLELNNLQTVNFQITNINTIFNIHKNTEKIFFSQLNNLILYKSFFFNICQKNLTIKRTILNKIKIYSNFFKYLNNCIISNNKTNKFFINLNNLYNLNINKVLNKKLGIIYFNNLLAYNLTFLGFINNVININQNFNLKDIIFFYDTTSYIDWFSYRNYRNLVRKLYLINYSINSKRLFGITIPATNIINTEKSFYLNSFGNILRNNALFVSKNTKTLKSILKSIINLKKI